MSREMAPPQSILDEEQCDSLPNTVALKRKRPPKNAVQDEQPEEPPKNAVQNEQPEEKQELKERQGPSINSGKPSSKSSTLQEEKGSHSQTDEDKKQRQERRQGNKTDKARRESLCRQRLHAAIIKTLKSRSLRDLKSRAFVAGDSIIVPHVSLSNFVRLKTIIPSIPEISRGKLDFDRSRLIITIPSRAHETLARFGIDMIQQMRNADFLPPGFGKTAIRSTGNASVNVNWRKRVGTLQPDAGIALFDSEDTPFLVLEIAASQSEKSVKAKMRDYILGTQGRTRLAVLVLIDRTKSTHDPSSRELISRVSSTSSLSSVSSNLSLLTNPIEDSSWNLGLSQGIAAPRSTQIQQGPNPPYNTEAHSASDRDRHQDLSLHPSTLPSDHLPDDVLPSFDQFPSLGKPRARGLDADDRVFVSVYRAALRPNDDAELPDFLSVQQVIDRVQVYPKAAAHDCCFTITWADVNFGPWDEAVRNLGLPLDTSSPKSIINFDSLNSLAHEAAGTREPSANLPIERLSHPSNDNYVVLLDELSSSPQADLPSSETESSEIQRRLDSDFESESTSAPSSHDSA